MPYGPSRCSITAEATWRLDRLKLGKIEFDNRPQGLIISLSNFRTYIERQVMVIPLRTRSTEGILGQVHRRITLMWPFLDYEGIKYWRLPIIGFFYHLMEGGRQQWPGIVVGPRGEASRSAAPEYRSTIRRLWLVGFVLIAIVTSQDVYTIWTEHTSKISESERDVTTLSAVLAEYTSRYMTVADLTLKEVQADPQFITISTFQNQISSPAFHANLARKVVNIPGDNSIAVFDADGELVNTSRPGKYLKFNVADRDYFTHFRAHDDPNLYIGKPAESRHVNVSGQSRAVGSWTLILARRLVASDGQFLGVVVVAIDIESLHEFYRSALTKDGQTVTLLRRDGVVVARYPDPNNSVGTSMPPASPWHGIVANNGGTYRSPGFFGASPSIVAARPLRDYGLVIDAVITESEALAEWRNEAFWDAAGSLLSVTCFIVLFSQLARQLRRLQRQAGQLGQERDFSLALTSSLPGLFVLINEAARLVRWNSNLPVVLGLSEEELKEYDASAMVAANDRERAAGAMRDAFAVGLADVEFGVESKTGKVRSVRWSGRRITLEGNRYLLAVGTDVTEMRQAEASLRVSQARYRDLFEASRDAIMLVDPSSGKFVSANPSTVKMFGAKDQEAFLSRTPAEQSPDRQPDGRLSTDKSEEMIQTALRTGDHLFEWTHRRFDGTEFPADVLLTPVTEATRTYIYATVRDISDRKLAEAQIVRMARFDQLTGLANRHVFVELLDQAIARARRGNTCFAVLYLDLDHFKDVNDALGHPVGDVLLKAVGGRLRANIREVDTVARFGGDEFAIILDDISEPASAAVVSERILGAIRDRTTLLAEVSSIAADVADKIVKAMADPITIQANRLHLSASVGIAVYGPDSPDAETMLSHADLALYRAKAEQRGSYRFFAAGMDTEVRARVNLTAELREAIASDQFFLVYQPQVDIHSGRIVGLEALVRWRHPMLGTLGPGNFVPIAERSGLIIPLGRWVMDEACRQTRQWLDAGVDLPLISVNLSVIQLKMPIELENDITAAMVLYALPSGLLELELTESVLMEASREHNEVLLRLRARGIRIAIDDFGSGYSSLDYLRRYPVERIKLDQTFIADIGMESGTDAIVRAAIGLSRELGIELVVEGVETVAQLDLLKAWGGRIVQGYYFARPLPVSAVTALLRVGKITPLRADPVEIVTPV